MKLDQDPLATAARPAGRNVLLLCLAWAFVGVPLAWGVSRTVSSSIPLFTAAPPSAAPPAVKP
jgi:hypothetical protein